MKKNQLFKTLPDIKITLQLLNLFGIKDFNDNHSFTKLNLIDLNIVNNIINISDDLKKYYLPCKYKIYLTNLNEKKCITILRQFIKIHNQTLHSKEKYVNGKKLLHYQIIPMSIDNNINKKSKFIIHFD